ncbi:hypothetical protein ACP3V7_25220, partial [Salmonella enterica]|uniref:hypothetical protein n=1 Tax=Salmonella enterica TaxID=28901 RepID=UPI003CF60DFA
IHSDITNSILFKLVPGIISECLACGGRNLIPKKLKLAVLKSYEVTVRMVYVLYIHSDITNSILFKLVPGII